MEDYVRTPVEEESLREATRRFRSGRGSDLSAEELARIARRVQELKRERRAVVLAHYYVPAETQALAPRRSTATPSCSPGCRSWRRA